MGYDPAAEPPSGEICIRGPAVFKGYFNQPELTAECIGESARQACGRGSAVRWTPLWCVSAQYRQLSVCVPPPTAGQCVLHMCGLCVCR